MTPHPTSLPTSAVRRAIDPGTVLRSLAAKGISPAKLSDANLRDLGVTREQLEAAAQYQAGVAAGQKVGSKGKGKAVRGMELVAAAEKVKAKADVPAKNPEKGAKKAGKAVEAAPAEPAPAQSSPAQQDPAVLPEWTQSPDKLSAALASLDALPYRPEYCVREKLAFHALLSVQSPSNNELRKMHFAAYRKRRQRFAKELSEALKDCRPPALQRAALIFVRRCGNEGLDWDNAYGGLKPVQDCLSLPGKETPDGLGIVVDDSPRHMPFPPFVLQGKAKPGKGSIEVFVFDLEGVAVAEHGNAWLG